MFHCILVTMHKTKMANAPTPQLIDVVVFDDITSYKAYDWTHQVTALSSKEAPKKKKHQKIDMSIRPAKKRKVGQPNEEQQYHYVCTHHTGNFIRDVLFASHVSTLKTPKWLSAVRKSLFSEFKITFVNAFFGQHPQTDQS